MLHTEQLSSSLFSTVIGNGYCIGCGACAALDPTIKIAFNSKGQYEATSQQNSAATTVADRVCPFADGNANEDELGSTLYAESGKHDTHLGYHMGCYAGWVVESDFRDNGSSGGIASWLLHELLHCNLIDHVVHVAPVADNSEHPLFHYTISSTPSEIRSNAKSRYYPIEMSGVIRRILDQPGRYAVTGLPCFIKALRLASRESDVLRQRLKFTVGIVCGHLKSTAFAELFAWQCGIAPKDLRSIDFRTKIPGQPASRYGVTVTGTHAGEPVSITKRTSDLYGSNWALGFFKYKACEFCDDVVGETADISIGDAWLPEYEGDSAGTNIVVVRSTRLHSLLQSARDAGRLRLDTISASKAIESQAAGFRHRREGLAYRLSKEDSSGNWRPTKRVQPSETHLSTTLKGIHSARYAIGMASHEAFAQAKRSNHLPVFSQLMSPLTSQLDSFYRVPLLTRLVGKVKRMFQV